MSEAVEYALYRARTSLPELRAKNGDIILFTPPDLGVIVTPKSMPAAIAAFLDSHRRLEWLEGEPDRHIVAWCEQYLREKYGVRRPQRELRVMP